MSVARRVARHRMQESTQLRKERDALARVVKRFAILHAALVLSDRIEGWCGERDMANASKLGRRVIADYKKREAT